MKLTTTFATVTATLVTTFSLSAAFAQSRPGQRPATRTTPARTAAKPAAPVTVSVPFVLVTPTPAPVVVEPTPTPLPQFNDIHAYQTQSLIRQTDGTFLVMPATVSDYKIFIPGKPEPVLYPKTALVYEKRNPLSETQFMGGNFVFLKGGYLATVSADGFFTYKGKVNFEPDVIGGNFFTKKGTNEIVVIDSYGFFVETKVIAPAIRLVGGNFFIDQSGVLTTIKSVGFDGPGSNRGLVVSKTGTAAVDCSTVVATGANYFLKQDGTIVTIDAKNGFYSDPYTPESRPSVVGGNYFIGEDNAVYTVSSEGGLFKTVTLPARPTLLGYSYMKFSDGSFAIVTANGGLHTEAVRVGTAGKAEYITKISNDLESKVYLPNNNRRN